MTTATGTARTPVRRAGGLVVGYEGGRTGHDAIAFANQWAAASGDEVTVATVHPGAAPRGAARVDAEWVAYEREEADRLLHEARGLVADGVRAVFLRVDAGSAAHGLSDLVEPEGDDRPLLVLGSRQNRGMRRTFPGSTGDRLLHGAASPVTIVPWGYADLQDRSLSRVAVAFVDTPDGHEAFRHAARIAQHLGGRLTVLSVVPDTRVVPGLGESRQFATDQRQEYQAGLDDVVSSAPEGLTVDGRLLDGPVVDALADLSLDDHDLLVVGSRGYGPVRRVLLGGVSARVVRHARMPVVVAPRGG
jgi:nucleotide-binding universal stress UspA family protein